MQELKSVLDRLNSALSELEDKIAGVDKDKESIRVGKIRQDERDVILDNKAKDLDAREGKVKEIESIVEFKESAKRLMKDARAEKASADERQTKLEVGLKKLTTDRAKLDKDRTDIETAQKKQVEALKEERKELDKKVKEFKIRKKVEEDLNK